MTTNIRRSLVTVYLRNEEGVQDQIQTYINLEPFDAAKYYVGKKFNIGCGGYNYIMKCVSIRCDGVQERKHGKWNSIPHPDSLAWYKLAYGSIVRSEW